MHTPRLAVFKFASCDGCQLSLLGLEDELVALAGKLDVVYFLEATSRIEPGPYDIALVEGSITTPDDAQRIRQVRERREVSWSRSAPAPPPAEFRPCAIGPTRTSFCRPCTPRPQYIDTLATSTAIADHVPVDFELRGCPINKHQLLEVLSALLAGRRPRTPVHSVCLECKRRGTVCVMVAQGIPCLGPVTHDGCGAICPSYDRGCYGCFGPCEQPNLPSLSGEFQQIGVPREALVRSLRNSFNGYAPEFRVESDRLAAEGE